MYPHGRITKTRRCLVCLDIKLKVRLLVFGWKVIIVTIIDDLVTNVEIASRRDNVRFHNTREGVVIKGIFSNKIRTMSEVPPGAIMFYNEKIYRRKDKSIKCYFHQYHYFECLAHGHVVKYLNTKMPIKFVFDVREPQLILHASAHNLLGICFVKLLNRDDDMYFKIPAEFGASAINNTIKSGKNNVIKIITKQHNYRAIILGDSMFIDNGAIITKAGTLPKEGTFKVDGSDQILRLKNGYIDYMDPFSRNKIKQLTELNVYAEYSIRTMGQFVIIASRTEIVHVAPKGYNVLIRARQLISFTHNNELMDDIKNLKSALYIFPINLRNIYFISREGYIYKLHNMNAKMSTAVMLPNAALVVHTSSYPPYIKTLHPINKKSIKITHLDDQFGIIPAITIFKILKVINLEKHSIILFREYPTNSVRILKGRARILSKCKLEVVMPDSPDLRPEVGVLMYGPIGLSVVTAERSIPLIHWERHDVMAEYLVCKVYEKTLSKNCTIATLNNGLKVAVGTEDLILGVIYEPNCVGHRKYVAVAIDHTGYLKYLLDAYIEPENRGGKTKAAPIDGLL